MPAEFQIESARLTLRHFTLDDAEFILELLNDPQWLQFIGDKGVHSLEDARHYLKTGPLAMYQELGFGLNCVTLKNSLEPIGMCGILKRDSLDNVDLGFALLSAHRGKGYALEAAEATLTHARDVQGIEVIDAIALADNTKSIALLEQLNFGFKRTIENETELLALYSIKFATADS